MPYGVILATFMGAAVEWTEAFTIVLAVSLTIGWRAAAGASMAALGVLALATLAGTALLDLVPDLALAQGVIGVFLVLFGVRWLGKAIGRAAGLKPLHDEAAAFEVLRSTAQDRRASWWIAFNGTLLEGLEVWLIVVALGNTHHILAAAAALAALVLVVVAGVALRKPLAMVPENALKFAVGGIILAFGTFWVLGAVGYVWPGGDAALLAVAIFYLSGGYILVQAMKKQGDGSFV